MKTIIKILICCYSLCSFSAKSQTDTIHNWKLKFAYLRVPYISPKGNWIVVKKEHRQNLDTMLVFHTRNTSLPVKKILCSAVPLFFNDDGILGVTPNKAEFLNLKTNKKYEYTNVRNAFILQEFKKFALLTKDNSIQIYNLFGEKTFEISGIDPQVPQVVSDAKSRLYIKKQNAKKWEIIELSGEKAMPIYSTANQVRRIDFTPSKKELFIIESLQNGHDNLLVFDSQNSARKLFQLSIPQKSELKFTEIQEGRAYLISAKTKLIEKKDPLVDIWYGNDPCVNEHRRLFEKTMYWLWNTEKNELKALKTTGSETEIQSLNNQDYFLSFKPRKNHNYITSEPELNQVQLYDVKQNALTNLGDLKLMKLMKKGWRAERLNEQVMCSADGRWFLASDDGLRWSLFKSSGEKVALIDKSGLEQPMFSATGDDIYFESSNDLWKYDIKHKKLIPLGIAKGKMTRIKNHIIKRNFSSAVSYLPSDAILVETYEKDKGITSYVLLDKGKIQTIIPPTENRINNLLYDSGTRNYYTLEENFNLPPVLFKYASGKPAKMLFDGNIKDTTVRNIKQEILDYTAIDKKLNGILYYPTYFDPKKKYPMVVHIYEMQRSYSNEYLSPNNVMPVGFQIRTLLERGYFVYLPDITYGKKGTGLSALECVNKAMDAVLENPNVDSTKVGLGGHSHGGYETNFISTHSKRFATYVSGTGNSDIIRSYYSYNYNFAKPFYFQFETGQYSMGTSVADDKERYLKNSPILNVEYVNSPILLWAGKKDENIAWDQVMEFYIGLRRYKKEVIALFYPNQGHAFFNEIPEEKDLSLRVVQWWDYFLKDKKDVPWIDQQIKKDAD